jgi:hypothetical protein
MALIAVVLLGLMARPLLSTPTTAHEAPHLDLTAWVPVVEVPDPTAPLLLHAITPKPDRFVKFVPSETSEPDPIPEPGGRLTI